MANPVPDTPIFNGDVSRPQHPGTGGEVGTALRGLGQATKGVGDDLMGVAMELQQNENEKQEIIVANSMDKVDAEFWAWTLDHPDPIRNEWQKTIQERYNTMRSEVMEDIGAEGPLGIGRMTRDMKRQMTNMINRRASASTLRAMAKGAEVSVQQKNTLYTERFVTQLENGNIDGAKRTYAQIPSSVDDVTKQRMEKAIEQAEVEVQLDGDPADIRGIITELKKGTGGEFSKMPKESRKVNIRALETKANRWSNEAFASITNELRQIQHKHEKVTPERLDAVLTAAQEKNPILTDKDVELYRKSVLADTTQMGGKKYMELKDRITALSMEWQGWGGADLLSKEAYEDKYQALLKDAMVATGGNDDRLIQEVQGISDQQMEMRMDKAAGATATRIGNKVRESIYGRYARSESVAFEDFSADEKRFFNESRNNLIDDIQSQVKQRIMFEGQFKDSTEEDEFIKEAKRRAEENRIMAEELEIWRDNPTMLPEKLVP